MAPIPVHTASPINANSASNPFGASSPSAAAARYTPLDDEGQRPTSTEPSGLSLLQQPARPGAPAVPQPTNTLASTYNNRYEPTATSTNTTATSDNSPPPPQPGAVPSPSASPFSPTPSAPLPPRPLEIPNHQQWMPPHASPQRQTAVPVQAQTPTHSRPLPMQSPSSAVYTSYTPTRSIPPAGVTSTATGPSHSSYPQPQDLSHPPGYQQDHHSSFDDKPVESCQENDYRASLSPLSYSKRGGILDGEWSFGSQNGGDSNGTVVQTAMSWAKAAGKRLSETERQIWKHINGEDDT
ncbi:uncharacterized protein Z520_09825 [Fonsecaea multimorphosa CBS 102226]|uniref:Uncharacterized protein n=1 Tax=Fonsecaea multimorphosa CBS 102226 TaxID=1442371 RepID=A0A0D2JVA4_9EURO|nr:uncharacterized protein Z520_09825 [Fonsecaea multimorphosa CBS 102226]KIX94439.1 hypothetical protein Z520_09825 [Fonsecaea multimorphosa CBS 102226]OAL20020.1 hypothetical protein AYO22_09170 [Fonsecaea multimorphosa]